ncbi:MAG: sensor histidine kinase, partial [Candidatus Electrothrix sp. AR3]|nr:sensor histidine kinase [Candidatus Electrothrix sp. AR3]
KGRPEIFSLHELLYSIGEMIQVQPAFKDIELSIQSGATQDMVYADKDQLCQVVLNCLMNSADAVNSLEQTDYGKIIMTTDLPEADRIRLRITDNGAGIEKDQVDNIFDPFYTSKEPGKGTGLGLSVSRSIMENVGGRMEMESRKGKGSIMSIFLPLNDGVMSYD